MFSLQRYRPYAERAEAKRRGGRVLMGDIVSDMME